MPLKIHHKGASARKRAVADIYAHKAPRWKRHGRTVSLRRHLYRRHPILTSVGALGFVLAALLAGESFWSHANTVYWYPQSCLGGWQNTEHAAGAPELSQVSTLDDFNANNSAILDDSISQIFCGGFQGEVPEGSLPVAVTLSISWAFKERAAEIEPVVEEAAAQDGGSFSTTTEGVSAPEPQASGEPVNAGEAPGEAVPDGAPAATDSSEPPSEAAPVSQPETSPEALLLRFSAPRAFAQEDVVASGTLAQENVPENETVPSESLETNAAPEPATPAPAIPETDLLRVLYSTDGENWQVAGAVDDSNWRQARFPILVSSWEDLRKLQVSLASLPVAEIAPVIYLDGMSLVIEHDGNQGILEELQPANTFDFKVQNVVVQVDAERNAKIATDLVVADLPAAAGELQFFAVPPECFGSFMDVKQKLLTQPYCGDPIGFAVYRPEEYSWHLDRDIRIAIGACRSKEEDCDGQPEKFLLGFLSAEVVSKDLGPGSYVFNVLESDQDE